MKHQTPNFLTASIIGLVVEFVVAIDEARVRFTDDALDFLRTISFLLQKPEKEIKGHELLDAF